MSASIKGLGTSRLRTASSSDLDEVDAVVPPTAATIKRAQRFVASKSLNVEDARELLDALGLLSVDHG